MVDLFWTVVLPHRGREGIVAAGLVHGASSQIVFMSYQVAPPWLDAATP